MDCINLDNKENFKKNLKFMCEKFIFCELFKQINVHQVTKASVK